jgi:hypothetical protein
LEIGPGVRVECDSKPTFLQKSLIVYPFTIYMDDESGRSVCTLQCIGAQYESVVVVLMSRHDCSTIKMAALKKMELGEWTKRISEAFSDKAEKRGELYIYDKISKKWKRRNVVLSEYTLQYFSRVQKVYANMRCNCSMLDRNDVATDTHTCATTRA